MVNLTLSESAPPLRPGDVLDHEMAAGPRSLLDAGVVSSLAQEGLALDQLVFVPQGTPPRGDALSHLHWCLEQVAFSTQEAAARGSLPLTLGDCTVAIGVMAGLQRRSNRVAVVWMDAHGDLNTEASSLSGYLGGMPLGCLLGHSLPGIARALGLTGLAETSVIHVGARDLDPYEEAFLERSRVTVVSCQEVNEPGLQARTARNLGKMLRGHDAVYLHVDVDVLDPSVMPCVTFPSPLGLSLDALSSLITALAASAPVWALTVSAFNPARPGAGRAGKVLAGATSRWAASLVAGGSKVPPALKSPDAPGGQPPKGGQPL
ncbi:MAG: arginase family protein [Bacillota bacterium]